MSKTNFEPKFLFHIAQAETTNSLDNLKRSNSIEIDANSNNLLEPSFNLISLGGLIGGGIAGILLILIVSGFVYTRLYRIIKPNEAIIRSGGFGPFWSGKATFTQGGCVVIPGLHQTIGVPLSEVRIQVIRKGESSDDQGAVRTKDYLRAKLTATMYVVVNINSVETAAARLCNDSSGKVTEADIRAAVIARCDDALRNAAKQRTLTEIDSDKVGFGTDVKDSLQQSLDSLGLTLQDVTLTDIEEDATAYRDNDYFDVQGKREREEKVCQSKLETAKVQSETETQLAAVDRDKALELQTIKLEKEQAEATLEAETTVIKAEKQREAEEGKEAQLAILAQKKEALELEKEQAKIDKQTSIEEAERDAQKKLLLKQQEVEVADIERETKVKKAGQTSEQELIVKRQEVMLADQQARQQVAASEKQTNEIQAQVAKAESAIMTATEIEVAERNQKIAEILAQQQANARKIQQETDALAQAEALKIAATAEANAQKIKAQGDLAAANDTAQSIVAIAEARKEEKLKLAEGELEYIKAINSKEEIVITAELLRELAPDLVKQLPQIAQNLTPEVKEAKLYSFGEASSNSFGASKQLASISGLGMLQEIMESDVGSQAVSSLTKLINSKVAKSNSNEI